MPDFTMHVTDLDRGPSPHLTWEELACRDSARTPYPEELRTTTAVHLAEAFEAVRLECGNRPLRVVSGYRTQEHNEVWGGASRSQHVHGAALDIAMPVHIQAFGEFAAAVFRAREMCPDIFKGIGVYPSRRSIHIDVRESRSLAFWTA